MNKLDLSAWGMVHWSELKPAHTYVCVVFIITFDEDEKRVIDGG